MKQNPGMRNNEVNILVVNKKQCVVYFEMRKWDQFVVIYACKIKLYLHLFQLQTTYLK